MAGTTAPTSTRSLGIGYPGGSLLLPRLRPREPRRPARPPRLDLGRASTSPGGGIFYWLTITFSRTLGTALGDWAADSGLGYSGARLWSSPSSRGAGRVYFPD